MKRARLKNLDIEEVSLVRRPANPRASILFHKSQEGTMDNVIASLRKAFRIAVSGTDERGTILPTEELQSAAIDKALAGLTLGESVKLIAEADGTPPPEAETTMDPVTKAEVEAIQKENEKLLERVAKAEATAAASSETVAKMLAASVRKEVVEKTKIMLGRVPGDAEKVADIVAKLDGEELASFEAILKASNEAFRQAQLTQPLVRTGVAGDATAQVTALAKERSTQKGITLQKAMSEVLHENPALYEAMSTTVAN